MIVIIGERKLSRFWNLDWTVRSDQENLEPLIFAILLALRTPLWEKNRDLWELWSDLTVLRTVIRPLLPVPYFPFESGPLKKKKKKKQQQHRKTSFKLCSLQSKSWWWRGSIIGANSLCKGDRRNKGFQRRRKDGYYRSLRLSLVISWIDGTAIFSP